MTIPQENGIMAKKVDNTRRKGPMIFRYPKGVYFCLLNEFSERFSFYGFCTILMLYLKSRFDMSKSTATLAFHAFICLSYFSSIFGSIWADGFVGPYKVVVFTSVIYLLGPSLVTLSAMPIDGVDDYTMKIVGVVGLLITAWCSGARKPCATAFPANQFPNHMVEERNQMFAMFYLLTYTSALLSQLVTSHLRSGMQCMGQKTCYPMAWGSTALFTVVALIVLACGHRFFQKSPPATENVIWKAIKCMQEALAEKMRGGGVAKNDPNAHWLDLAYPAYDKKFINDVKSALKVNK
uniref:Uncharacterized protein n=1 Tax=Romanomermis culicivorax TaxID=13658 RepID=A0A915I8V8_ROMCU